MNNLRFYTFVNFYLSSIQQGIQSAHIVHEAFIKYFPRATSDLNQGNRITVLYEWANSHKTMIVLNGGIDLTIHELFTFLRDNDIIYDGMAMPWASFNEDQQSLAGVMTGVGIVLPEEIYGAVDYKTACNTSRDPREFLNSFDLNDREGAYFYLKDGEVKSIYPSGSPIAQFIFKLKSCPLAR